MTRLGEQFGVMIDTCGIDFRSRTAQHEACDFTRPARNPGKDMRGERIDEQELGHRREQLGSEAGERQQRRAKPNHDFALDHRIKHHPQPDRDARRMANNDRGFEIKFSQQPRHGFCHRGQRLGARRGKTMAGQIGRNDGKVLGEQRDQIAPAVRRRARAMQQQ